MLYGLPKMVEETGELCTELGKALAFPVGPHPDGRGDLRQRILNECADVLAAIAYFAEWNFSEAEQSALMSRAEAKFETFMGRGMAGVSPAPPTASQLPRGAD